MRIALVHDWLLNLGGAERVLIELHKTFPEAPIYTLFSSKEFTDKHLPTAQVINSSLNKFPFIKRLYPYLAVFMPAMAESFDLSSYDTVISSSVSFSKGLILKPKTKHICYCYSPTRWLWDRHAEYERRGILAGLAKHFLRFWDRHAADRVDEFVAISDHVAKRINKYYRRDAKVVHPPTAQLATASLELPDKASNYYLVVSRLHPHKNVDIAIHAFNKLKYSLIIVGDGPEKKKLVEMSRGNIKFVGEVSDEELAKYYANCRALIMPQEEDFGLTPIEAMMFGKPTLALRKGGALETVKEGVTGEFFDDPIPEALADGIRRLNENYGRYYPQEIKKAAEAFSIEHFRREILGLVTQKV